ncbi:MAG: hypothetical protein K2H61_02810 [Muribaculaceae bacterium]|nr:hypothetical protein [Muribaculaceae bacterium]
MAKGKKTGGRQKGTPNRDNPLKGLLRAHSLAYFTPKPQLDDNGNPRKIVYTDKEGETVTALNLSNPDGSPREMSDFEVDMLMMEANDRVHAELRLLEFHQPKMKSVDIDVAQNVNITIEDRLRDLCDNPDGVTDDPDDD